MVSAAQTGLSPEDEEQHLPILTDGSHHEDLGNKGSSVKRLAEKSKHLFTNTEHNVASKMRRVNDLFRVHSQVSSFSF